MSSDIYKYLPTDKIPTYCIPLPESTEDVTIEVRFSNGYLLAPEGKQEVAHLLEHYLYRDLIEKGFDCHGRTNLQLVTLYAIVPQKELREKLSSFLQIILNNPLNNPAIFEKEQSILENELAGIIDAPEEYLYRASYNAHTSIEGPFLVDMASYRAIKLEDLQKFYREQCLNRCSVWVGGFQLAPALEKEIVDEVNAISLPKQLPFPATFPGHEIAQAKIVASSSLNRTWLRFSWLAPAAQSEIREQIAMNCISTLLSDDNGLLWPTVRDGEGLVYDLTIDAEYGSGYGLLHVCLAVLPEKVERCREIIHEQVRKIGRGEFSKKLFDQVVKEGIASSKEEWSNNSGRFYWVQDDLMDRKRAYSWNEWAGFYKELKKEDLEAVARKYLQESQSVEIMLIAEK